MKTNDISLFLDKKSLEVTGEIATLRWVVNSGQAADVYNVQVSLRELTQDAVVTVLPSIIRATVPLRSNEAISVTTQLKVPQSASCSFEIVLAGHCCGRDFELIGREPLILVFEKPQSGRKTTIEIGNAIVPEALKVPAQGDVLIKIGDGAAVDGLDFGQGASAAVRKDWTDKDLLPVPLCQAELAGLNPLNFDILVADWPNQNRELGLFFVNAQGQPINQADVHAEAERSDFYRARLTTLSPGYLTLIAQGSSGKYYAMFPNPHGIGSARLEAGATYFFPGPELLDVEQLPEDMREWTFSLPAGRERLLALLTPQPLWPVLPVYSPVTTGALIELFRQASKMLGSQICLASVDTTERF